MSREIKIGGSRERKREEKKRNRCNKSDIENT